jgi:hypothetical protein
MGHVIGRAAFLFRRSHEDYQHISGRVERPRPAARGRWPRANTTKWPGRGKPQLPEMTQMQRRAAGQTRKTSSGGRRRPSLLAWQDRGLHGRRLAGGAHRACSMDAATVAFNQPMSPRRFFATLGIVRGECFGGRMGRPNGQARGGGDRGPLRALPDPVQGVLGGVCCCR